jgi:MFS family permease
MSQVVDAIAPPRFGGGFRRLLASAWASDLGDGIALAAGPLLVVSQTRDPFLIALATLLQRLPWLVFGLHAGVIADRYDRRRIIVIANAARAAVLGVLAIMIVTEAVSVTVVLVAMTLLGTAEVFVDTTSQTLLPMLVRKEDLGVANSRLMFGRITINRLGGPALGALLFAAGMAVPFVLQAVCVAFAANIVWSIVIDRPVPPETPASAMTEIKEGLRWVWDHPAIRTLTITIFAFNITFGAVWAILVLYSVERLGLDDIGFGLLTSFGAAGGVVVALTYGRIERRLGATNIMRIGLTIEVLMHLTFAINTSPLVAFGVFFVFGMHEAAWGTTSTTIRQRVVPREFQGRVSSVNGVGVFSTLVVGALLGGLIASRWGVTGPFWFGFVGSSITLIAIWRQLGAIATTD